MKRPLSPQRRAAIALAVLISMGIFVPAWAPTIGVITEVLQNGE